MTFGRLAVVCLILGALQVGLALYAGYQAPRMYQAAEVDRYFSADYQARFQRYRDARWASARVLYPVETVLPLIFVFAGPLLWLMRRGVIADRHPLVQSGLIMAAFVVWNAVLLLPFSYRWSYLVERSFGFSRQSPLSYLADEGKQLALAVVLASGVSLIFVAVYRALPRGWPLLAGAVLSLLAVFFTIIFPWVVEPLFYKFHDVPPGKLRTQIEMLARDHGVGIKRLLIMQASEKTSRTNAYVSGLFNSHRVVLYDTLLEKNTESEALSVVAHELGHSALNHVGIGLALSIAMIVLGVFASAWAIPRALALLGIDAALRNPAAALPVLLVVGGQLSFFGSPIGSAVSRRMESAADRFSLEATRDPQAAVSMEKKLTEDNLGNPNPTRLGHLMFASHPDPISRIRMAERWR
jgi:STE24 endopeptidase